MAMAKTIAGAVMAIRLFGGPAPAHEATLQPRIRDVMNWILGS
jgi:hypothetical protein